MTESDVHALTGPYVLDALPEDERTRFEEHVIDCAFCSTEVEELREAAVKLATQVAAPPPPGLKSDVMAAIEQIRQVPTRKGPERVARHWFSWRSMLALAAAALAVATTGGIAIDQHRDKSTEVQANNRMAAVLAEPDARTVHGTVSGGGQATLVTSTRRDAAVVVLHDLRKLPGNRTWQLWLVDDSQVAHSVGLVAGNMTQVINSGVRGKVAFGLTVEPVGGSATPTMPAAAMIAMT